MSEKPSNVRGYVATSQLAAEEAAGEDPNETARKIIATWTRGLITLSEMVTDLQKVADAEHRKLLQAGAELAEQRPYAYLDDPAEREWLTKVAPMDVLKNAHRIYDLMAEAGLSAESMIREEAFRKASHALIIDYDVFYQAWLNEMPVGPAAIRRAKNVTA